MSDSTTSTIKKCNLTSTLFFLVSLLTLPITAVDAFGVSYLPGTLKVVCGTPAKSVIGNLTVQKAFWPIAWNPTYLGGDPFDSTTYFTIDPSTGEISRNEAYPSTFTQQVYKIDGSDASDSINLVSAFITIIWPKCGN